MTDQILVIEPHPDDAFLCLHEHMNRRWKNDGEVTILTVFSDTTRSKEASEYAESIGVASVTLGLEESKMLSGSRPKVIGPLVKFLKANGSKYDRVVCPLGLQHPDHLSVRRTVDASGIDSQYYLDSPYQTKQKNQEDLLSRIEGLRVVSLWYPGKRKWAAKSIFKTQSKFFYYNPFEEWKLAELVLASD